MAAADGGALGEEEEAAAVAGACRLARLGRAATLRGARTARACSSSPLGTARPRGPLGPAPPLLPPGPHPTGATEHQTLVGVLPSPGGGSGFLVAEL
jgi:hypothetical protein